MKFITKRSSATGKKFAEIEKRRNEAFEAQKKITKKLGADKWRQAYWVAWGGISSIIFKDSSKVDKKVWKNVNNSNEWMPRLNNKEGKIIMASLKSLPFVSGEDLNQCVGFYGAPFKTIGFASNSKEYFGFVLEDDWEFEAPKDCKEVTVSKYESIFGKKEIK